MLFFKKIRYKNFLSTGNAFTEIKLDQYSNTLIVGENGSGKSTILDAICFSLFGKAFRNINKPTLVNSTSGKDCVTEIEFSTNNKDYKIIRGIKPNIFEIWCDGVMIDQSSKVGDYQEDLEKYILRMNYKVFTQIVILGSAAFTPFMQLKAADRREVIEDLLDIQIFSIMNVVTKQKVQLSKEEADKLKYDLDVKDIRKDYIRKTLTELNQDNEQKLLDLSSFIKDCQQDIKDLEDQIKILNLEKDKEGKKLKNHDKFKEKHKKLIILQSKIENNLDRHKEHEKFYLDNQTCPTCKQNIEEVFKESILNDTKIKMISLDEGLMKLNEEISLVVQDIQELDGVVSRINNYITNISSKDSKIEILSNNIHRTQKEIDSLATKTINLNDKNSELICIEEEMRQVQSAIETNLNLRVYYDMVLAMLKDGGIKTKIIKQYLPIINKHINKYLTAMGFDIKFEINESFEEYIRSRYRDGFSYENFSEGEKMRIDLSLLFTWRAVAKLKNSVDTNLLILDEIFDGALDYNGIDEFIKIIKSLTKDTNTFMISPKGDNMMDKFANVIRFEKKKGYSRIVI